MQKIAMLKLIKFTKCSKLINAKKTTEIQANETFRHSNESFLTNHNQIFSHV